jgi:hypothetical protein
LATHLGLESAGLCNVGQGLQGHHG